MSKEPLRPEEIQQLTTMLDFVDDEQYYKLFGVAPTATEEEIQTAYYKISRQWHPDRFFRRDMGEYEETITEVFMAITAAFRTLSNPADRLTYDRTHAVEKEEKDSSNRQYARRKGKRRRMREKNRTSSNEKTLVKTLKEERREKVLKELQGSIHEKKLQAQKLYQEGLHHEEKSEVIKAAASMHLACKLDPSNEEYKQKYREIRVLARQAKGMELYALAENAENYQNYSNALDLYRKAVEYGVEEPQAYARLAYLLEKLDPDPRETLRLLQIAVQKDPNNPELRCRLGESYATQGLGLNARREFNAALKIDKTFARAKTGLSNL